MKVSQILLVLFLILPMGAAWSQSDNCEGPGETEPNDTRGQANLLDRPERITERFSNTEILGWEINGTCCSGDEDWFLLPGDEGSAPMFRFDHGMMVFPTLEIYSNDLLVASSDTTGIYSLEQISVPGQCYLRLYGTGTYTLVIKANGLEKNQEDYEPPGCTILSIPPRWPISESSALLIGGTNDGDWINSDSISPMNDEEYRLYSVDGFAGVISGSSLINGPDQAMNRGYQVQVTDTESLISSGTHYFGISSSWDPQPRPVTLETENLIRYSGAVEDILINAGIYFTNLYVKKVITADFGGDGAVARLIDSSFLTHSEFSGELMEHTVLVLEMDVEGKNTIIPLIRESDWSFSYWSSVGVLDVDGNDVMEIMEVANFYEAVEIRFWQVTEFGVDVHVVDSFGL